MIWGNLWDVTCNWIASEKDSGGNSIYDVYTNSSTWGNYKDYNTANEYEEGDPEYVSGAGSRKKTGCSEYWKAKNIYDLAGNCFEWTQEVYGGNNHCIRGGCYSFNSSGQQATDRENHRCYREML